MSEESGKLTYHFRKSGYGCDGYQSISLNQWVAINRILNGPPTNGEVSEPETVPVNIDAHRQQAWDDGFERGKALAAAHYERGEVSEPGFSKEHCGWVDFPTSPTGDGSARGVDDGEAGDAIDFACDHLSPAFAARFLEDWRGGALERWPGYTRWLASQRAGRDEALTNHSDKGEKS